MAGNRYFITFVDEFSRMLWIYVIKMKSDALYTFIKFKAYAERESGKKLKILRMDRGGEYTFGDFKNHYQACGIVHEVTTPYTPQHNGLVERRNRIIVNMAKCLLKEKNLPRKFWGEAVSTFVHILNRCSTK